MSIFENNVGDSTLGNKLPEIPIVPQNTLFSDAYINNIYGGAATPLVDVQTVPANTSIGVPAIWNNSAASGNSVAASSTDASTLTSPATSTIDSTASGAAPSAQKVVQTAEIGYLCSSSYLPTTCQQNMQNITKAIAAEAADPTNPDSAKLNSLLGAISGGGTTGIINGLESLSTTTLDSIIGGAASAGDLQSFVSSGVAAQAITLAGNGTGSDTSATQSSVGNSAIASNASSTAANSSELVAAEQQLLSPNTILAEAMLNLANSNPKYDSVLTSIMQADPNYTSEINQAQADMNNYTNIGIPSTTAGYMAYGKELNVSNILQTALSNGVSKSDMAKAIATAQADINSVALQLGIQPSGTGATQTGLQTAADVGTLPGAPAAHVSGGPDVMGIANDAFMVQLGLHGSHALAAKAGTPGVLGKVGSVVKPVDSLLTQIEVGGKAILGATWEGITTAAKAVWDFLPFT